MPVTKIWDMVCVYYRYRKIRLFCIKITLSIPHRLKEEVCEGVTN